MIADVASQPAWPEANEQYLRAAFRRLVAASSAHETPRGGRTTGRDISARTWMFDEPPALEGLVEAFRLSAPERDLLLWTAGVELDAEVAAVAAASTGRPTVTVQLALDRVPGLDLAALSPSRALRRWGLVSVDEVQPLVLRQVRIAERVLLHLAGAAGTEAMIEAIVRPVPLPSDMPTTQVGTADRIASIWAPTAEGWPVVELYGDDRDGRLDVAALVADQLGWRLYAASATDLPEDPLDRQRVATLWARESVLVSGALFIATHDGETGRAARLADLIPGPVFIGCDVALETRRPRHRVEVKRPPELARRKLWSAALGPELEPLIDIDAVASRYGASRRAIAQAAPIVRQALVAGDDPFAVLRDALGRPAGLTDLARAIEPAAGWDDLVVPDAVKTSLHQIADQVRNQAIVYERWGFGDLGSRGLGITALFAGESGTGQDDGRRGARPRPRPRPLSHRSVGRRQQVHRRDGEEPAARVRRRGRRRRDPALRRSRRAVRQAQRGQGQPRPLRQHRDQLSAPAHGGLSRSGDSDDQPARRPSIGPSYGGSGSSVSFPFPDVASREQIWRRMFPPATPLYRIDWSRLAEIPLPGGSIRVIAINAAFLAARDGGPVRMRHLSHATEAELEKLERPPTVADRRRWT